MESKLAVSKFNRRQLAKYRINLLKGMTEEELHIQKLLTKLGERFIPQKGFFNLVKFFIIDFYLPKRRKLCLEIDGGYHDLTKEYDEKRDWFLTKRRGFRVIRISNENAMNLNEKSLLKLIS